MDNEQEEDDVTLNARVRNDLNAAVDIQFNSRRSQIMQQIKAQPIPIDFVQRKTQKQAFKFGNAWLGRIAAAFIVFIIGGFLLNTLLLSKPNMSTSSPTTLSQSQVVASSPNVGNSENAVGIARNSAPITEAMAAVAMNDQTTSSTNAPMVALAPNATPTAAFGGSNPSQEPFSAVPPQATRKMPFPMIPQASPYVIDDTGLIRGFLGEQAELVEAAKRQAYGLDAQSLDRYDFETSKVKNLTTAQVVEFYQSQLDNKPSVVSLQDNEQLNARWLFLSGSQSPLPKAVLIVEAKSDIASLGLVKGETGIFVANVIE